MALFLIKRSAPEGLEAAGVVGIGADDDGAGVRWVTSFVSADRGTIYGLYEAADEDAVREATWRAGVTAEVIVRVEGMSPDSDQQDVSFGGTSRSTR